MSEVKTTMKKSIPWLYFLAMFCQMVGGTLAGSYLTYYMTGRMLITATVMGTVMLVARIVDGVIGLLSGVIVQKVCFRHGQYRSWLLYAPIMVAIGTTMCFINPNIPVMAKTVIVFVGYILYGAGMSFAQLSQNGMMAKIAGPDMSIRMTIAGKTIQGMNAATIVTSAITLPLIMYIESNSSLDGYTLVQVVYATLGLIGQIALFVGTKAYESYDPNFKQSAGAVSLGTMLSETLKNGQLILLMIADALRWGALMALISLGMYYFTDIMGNPNAFALAMTIQGILGFVSSLIAPPIAMKVGKKASALIGGISGAIAYAGIALFAHTNYIIYIVCNSIAIVGGSLIGACGANLYLDCGEYQLYKTGKDNRTFVMSMFGMATKIGIAISSPIVALILNASGYLASPTGVATIANPRLMVMLIGGIPASLYALNFILMLFYKITDEKAKEMAAHNFAQMQQKLGATPPVS